MILRREMFSRHLFLSFALFGFIGMITSYLWYGFTVSETFIYLFSFMSLVNIILVLCISFVFLIFQRIISITFCGSVKYCYFPIVQSVNSVGCFFACLYVLYFFSSI
jgi:hypothetical protein